MRRKSFLFKIGGKELVFFERNREDLDLLSITEKYRAKEFRFVQENTTDPDDRGMLLVKILDRKYSPEELSLFIYNSMEGIREVLWDSFKLGDQKIKREEFFQLIEGQERNIRDMLIKLEDLKDLKKKTPV